MQQVHKNRMHVNVLNVQLVVRLVFKHIHDESKYSGSGYSLY